MKGGGRGGEHIDTLIGTDYNHWEGLNSIPC